MPVPVKGHGGVKSACVVGAGVVGCATAFALSRSGWEVTLVDANRLPGLGSSFANGAQLSYSYVAPLASPDVLLDIPRWLLARDSPLKWRPRFELSHYSWLVQFLRHCRSTHVAQTTQALLQLSFLSRKTIHQWLDALAGLAQETKHRRAGKLVFYRSNKQRAGVEGQLVMQKQMGCRQSLIESNECVRLEPALMQRSEEIAFGVWTDDEEVIDPVALSNALAKASGATLKLGLEVTGIRHQGNRISHLELVTGNIVADHFVVAAGSGAASLLRTCGIKLPIEPIKGYSVTLPIIEKTLAPCVSITDYENKTVYARLGDNLRVAGFAEITGYANSVSPERIRSLCASTEKIFPNACSYSDPKPWSGLRPATPHGRPMIGPTRFENLWLNCGHGSLGLTLSAGSAQLLVALLNGQLPPISPAPFSIF